MAELNFGFWRYLTAAKHEKHLWVPYLHHALPAGTDRAADVDAPIARLHLVRNRAVHHEPLLRVNLQARRADIVALASMVNPGLGTYITATSTLDAVAAIRP